MFIFILSITKLIKGTHFHGFAIFSYHDLIQYNFDRNMMLRILYCLFNHH